MSLRSIWRDDTVRILDGETSVTVYSATFDYSTVPPSETASTTVESATVRIQPIRGDLKKEAKGLIAEATHTLHFPYTSSVAVNHRTREAGQSDYYEALFVAAYEDHNEVYVKLVEGR